MADSSSDAAPIMLGVIISMLALGGVFIWARVITRTIIKPQFGLDDALIVFTWFIILGYDIAMFIAISRGYGKHVEDLTPEQYSSAIHADVIGEVFAISAFPSGKASIAYLLLRIFTGKKLKWFLWSVVAANAVFFYVDAIFIILQCQPVAFQWDHTIPGGTCWDPKIVIDWGFLTGVTGAATDFVLAILPWFYIRKLKIGLREKSIVGFALSMGIFAAICSILKIYYTSTLGARSDYSFDTVPLVIWSNVELALINVAACIPTLRPLYLLLSGKNPEGTRKSSSYGSSYGTGSRQYGLFGHRSDRPTQLESSDDHDRNIYQFRTYDVSVKNYPSAQSGSFKTDNSLGATVKVNHGI